jgi:peptide deformylase
MNCEGIVQVPDPVLRQHCPRWSPTSVGGLQLANDLKTACRQSGRIGVAAPQIGRSERVFAIRDGIQPPVVYFNAEIISRSGSAKAQEGCLSIKDRWFDLTRSHRVEVRYQDIDGQRHFIEAEGLLARAFQHEIDHLNGILFIDLVAQEAKSLIRQQRRAVERQLAKVPA